MSNGQVVKMLALLAQPEEIRDLLKPLRAEEQPIITPYHVEKVSVLSSPTEKIAVLQKAADEGLTATQTAYNAPNFDFVRWLYELTCYHRAGLLVAA